MKQLTRILAFSVLIFILFGCGATRTSLPTANRVIIDIPEDDAAENVEIYSECAKAAIAVAEAYYDHVQFIQYDQLNMNRALRNSPRYEFATPETATNQRFIYMECGVFARNVYKNVMGYTIPKASDVLAEKYSNIKGERVYYWIGNPNQTKSDEKTALNDMLSVIEPGDVLYYSYSTNNHIMLYVGNGQVIHCTYSGIKDGGDYNYSMKTDKEEPNGALLKDDLLDLIDARDMFNCKNKVCLLRPSKMNYPITQNAKIRTEKLQDIVIYKTSSTPLGISVNPGDEVNITLEIKNNRDLPVTLTIAEEIPTEMEYISGLDSFENGIAFSAVTIDKMSAQTLTYTLKVKNDTPLGSMINCEGTRVEDMYISNLPIHVGKTLSSSDQQKISTFESDVNSSFDTLINDVYKVINTSPSLPSPKEILESLFKSNSSSKDSVKLTDKTEITQKYALVPWLFGGQNCSNPTLDNEPRIRKITESNLVPGDVIIYSELGADDDVAICVYIGNGYGVTTTKTTVHKIKTDGILDTLLGQYCFCVLRPSFIS